MMTCDTIALSVDLYRYGLVEFISRDVVAFYFNFCQALV